MGDVPGRLKAALADRYAIEGELGSGGMATVYLAHDLKHDRKVAIKVMRPVLSAILGGERFLHAYGEVRINSLSEQDALFEPKLAGNLRAIRRIIDEDRSVKAV